MHLVLTSWNGSSKGDFSLFRPEADRLVEGQWNDEPVIIGLKRVPTPDFLLLSRPFRWVSEEPFNR